MRKIKLIAWLLCFIFVCGLILLPAGRGHLQQFVSAHRGVSIYLLLAFLLAIPASLVTLVTAFLFEWLLLGWSRSSLKTLWEARFLTPYVVFWRELQNGFKAWLPAAPDRVRSPAEY